MTTIYLVALIVLSFTNNLFALRVAVPSRRSGYNFLSCKKRSNIERDVQLQFSNNLIVAPLISGVIPVMMYNLDNSVDGQSFLLVLLFFKRLYLYTIALFAVNMSSTLSSFDYGQTFEKVMKLIFIYFILNYHRFLSSGLKM